MLAPKLARSIVFANNRFMQKEKAGKFIATPNSETLSVASLTRGLCDGVIKRGEEGWEQEMCLPREQQLLKIIKLLHTPVTILHLQLKWSFTWSHVSKLTKLVILCGKVTLK